MEQEDKNQKYVIVATLAFIVGFGLSWLITANKAEETKEPKISDDTEKVVLTETILSSGSSILVSNQKAGSMVAIDSATLEEIGWVVIHENNEGQPGRILGAQLFDKGTSSGKVELLRGTTAGKIYYAMIHSDNGDRAFDPKKDLPVESNGLPVMQSFMTEQTSSI